MAIPEDDLTCRFILDVSIDDLEPMSKRGDDNIPYSTFKGCVEVMIIRIDLWAPS